MVKRVVTEYFDDLDGSSIAGRQPITFGLEGRAFEIDLSDANREKLHLILAPYVKAARLVRGAKRRAGK